MHRGTVSFGVAIAVALSLAASSRVAEAALVRVEGSDTIGGSLGIALGEEFHAFHPEVAIQWEGLGSSTAFVGLFDGSANLGASSRPVNEAELVEARRLGIKLQEFVIGYDGIAVVVHPSNPIRTLNLQQLADIFRGKVRNFREVGGDDRPIRLLSRPSYSGTHVFFRDRILRKGNSRGPEDFAPSTEWVEHTADLIQRVAEDPQAISFGGMAYLKPSVRALAVSYAPGRSFVESRPETVRDGSYPIFRQLLLYSRGEPDGAVREFVDFILSRAGQHVVAQVGFVPTETLAFAAAPPAVAAVAPPKPALATAMAPPASAVGRELPPSRRIYFRSGSAQLDDAALETLALVAIELKTTSLRIVISGHTDSTGPRAVNERLSRQRADAVRDRLRSVGIGEDRVIIESVASDRPIGTNENAGGRRVNRRVDLTFSR